MQSTALPVIPERLEDALDAVDPPREVVLENSPAPVEERNKVIASMWARLTKKQQLYLQKLEENGFNQRATLRAMAPYNPSATTVVKWKREADFAFILNTRKVARAAEVLEKNSIALAAADIREQALEPKPILYQGAPTGYEENQPEVALRANEQLARLGGHMKNDDGPVTGQGPAFVIQVVQRDGGVVDVTPRGVTIDLPAPGGT